MIVAVMASLALGEEFYLGGLIGALLIILGLYLVIWGKSEERKLEATKIMASSPSEDNESGIPGHSRQAQPSLSGN
ncbi:WD repeat-containing protein wat1 [Turnera subulata]|uniref:WD repeat-containing protein wat1 n=1 Tax=Turnera subulata TaxID=218843 RepID=A0A9Q0F1S3_9ROSI|nr:WD repeat-containing protein wat1 [Turnera subulata]